MLGLSACVNALWDPWAPYLSKPVSQVVADMTPEEFVRCVDFGYILRAITPEEAITMLTKLVNTKSERLKFTKKDRAVPAYPTQARWLRYSDTKMVQVLQD